MSNYITAESPKEMCGEIKKYMYIHDINQDDLANKIGISKQALSAKFKDGNPSLKSFFELMDALEVQMEYRLVAKNERNKK